MKIKVIHNDEAHEAAVSELERIMDSDPQPGTEAFDQIELLALVIKDYETRRYRLDAPDPIEAIKFRLEQQGLTRKDLERVLGSRARVSEVLNGRRPLSISMVRNLHDALQIPADVLIQQPRVGRKARNNPVRIAAPQKRKSAQS